MNKCPICGKDKSSVEALGLLRDLSKQHGIIDEIIPLSRGRILKFEHHEVFVGNECDWCDYEKLKKDLAIYN